MCNGTSKIDCFPMLLYIIHVNYIKMHLKPLHIYIRSHFPDWNKDSQFYRVDPKGSIRFKKKNHIRKITVDVEVTIIIKKYGQIPEDQAIIIETYSIYELHF